MLNPNLKLNADLFSENTPKSATRDGFGEGLVMAAEKNNQIVALSADLTESTKIKPFAQKFPERFIEVGVAEQNLVTVASGMASMGKIPFVASYAMFSPGRNWEQIRTTICYNNLPVKIIGAHSGISVGPDGGTHQALEDIALMRVIPKMVVLNPCDANEARKATLSIAQYNGYAYLRLAKQETPIITTEETPFEIGKGYLFFETNSDRRDISFISSGPIIFEVLKTALKMSNQGFNVSVINMPTIKPLDTKIILEESEKSTCIITVEEHQILAGLGGAVCEFLSEIRPTPIKRIGVDDQFGQSGDPKDLFKIYGLDSDSIELTAKKFLSEIKK